MNLSVWICFAALRICISLKWQVSPVHFGISRRIGLLYAYDDKKYSLSLGLSVYTNFQMLSIVRCVKNMRSKRRAAKLGYEYMLLTMSKMFIPVHMLKIDGL